MFVTGSHCFAAPPEAVWAALTDLAVLRAAALGAGCDHAEASARGGLGGDLGADFAASLATPPGSLSGRAQPAEIVPQERIELNFRATGDLGSLDGRLAVALEPIEAGVTVETLLRYELRVSLGGGLARAGSYRSENAAKTLGDRFCLALDELLSARPLAAVPNTALPPESDAVTGSFPADAAATGDVTESGAPITVSPTGSGELALTPEAPARSYPGDSKGIPVGQAGLSPWLWIPLLLVLVGLLMVYFR